MNFTRTDEEIEYSKLNGETKWKNFSLDKFLTLIAQPKNNLERKLIYQFLMKFPNSSTRTRYVEM